MPWAEKDACTVAIREHPVVLRGCLLVLAVLVPVATLDAAASAGALRSVLGVIAGLMSGLAALALESLDVVVDGRAKVVRWRRWRVLGGRSGIIPFAEVQRTGLDVTSDRDGTIAPIHSYRPVLVCAKEVLPLSLMSSISARDADRLREAVERVLTERDC